MNANPGGGGGQLPLKGHARLKKHVKRVVFHGRAMYARTVERVSKLPKFGKKGYTLQQLRYAFRVYILLIMKRDENTHFDTRLGYIFYSS